MRHAGNINFLAVTSAALAAAIVLLAGTARADICSDPADTAQGPVSGAFAPSGDSCVYKGIPYAAPPVGELRWKAPADAPARSEVFEALEFGSECPQIEAKYTGGDGKSLVGGEDCLFLNIWRPAKSGSFPVMVWIHGGALIQGKGSMDIYSGERLASERDLVVVTINYRLGVFGFLSHPEFAGENGEGASGNYGMLDQVKALEWVRANIASFGGDENNVTIFGESAGGWSVCNQIASPLAAGLFDKAIIQSGGCDTALTVLEGYEHGEAFAERLGCAGPGAAECMRSLPADVVFAAVKGPSLASAGKGRLFNFVPKADGHFLDDAPIEAIRQGRHNNVPLMVGSNRDEMKFFSMAIPGARFAPPFLVKRLVNMSFKGDDKRRFRELYPYRDYRLPNDALIDALGDARLGCANFEAAEAMAMGQDNVYYYRFDYDDHNKPHALGAAHALEIPFVFGALGKSMRRVGLYSEEQLERAEPLSELMGGYWANFARSGDPNGPGLPEWPAYGRSERMRMYFDQASGARPTDNVEKCDFWSITEGGF